ncbi:MAG: hypothetical protein LBK66_06980 [Spirochaetaceae bacterium]|jgi:hypothetical protein|nr:hypothetical protein [Spirochaetaceae bacterium]
MKKLILSLCGGSGSWESPYAAIPQEYRVINITLPENDVRTYNPPPGVYGVLAPPPCEAFSYARRTNGKQDKKYTMNLDEGLEIAAACLKVIEKCNPHFWALENPYGDINRHLGKPQYIFQPWQFGHWWTKKTCVWGNFNKPLETCTRETCPKLKLYTRPGRRMPSIAFLHKSAASMIPGFEPYLDYIKTDYDLRSITPPGFARAFFEANR